MEHVDQAYVKSVGSCYGKSRKGPWTYIYVGRLISCQSSNVHDLSLSLSNGNVGSQTQRWEVVGRDRRCWSMVGRLHDRHSFERRYLG